MAKVNCLYLDKDGKCNHEKVSKYPETARTCLPTIFPKSKCLYKEARVALIK